MEEPREALPAFGRRHWLVIAGITLIATLLGAGQLFTKEMVDAKPGVNWQAVVYQPIEWLLLGALTPIAYHMARRFPFRRGAWDVVLPAHAAGALLFWLTWVTVGFGIARAVDAPFTAGSVREAYVNWLLSSFAWSILLYFALVGSMLGYFYFHEARQRESQALRLSGQLAEARLSALRMQLNPHFLFNSLNAVTVLVREQNTRAASRMLELLGDLLRQVLRPDQPHQIPLAEELRFAEQYLAVEEVRFSDRLKVTWSIDDRARDALVPGFILQPLVENAVRHGVAQRANAGRVEIAARLEGDALRLVVRNDGASGGGGAERSAPMANGVGLSNTRERLRTTYGDAASLALVSRAGKTEAVISLPYRRATQ